MIIYDYDACTGCEECWKVCPRGVWHVYSKERKAVPENATRCIDCTACEFQCPPRAIRIERALIPKSPVILREQ
ncbi:MAG: ferredoxin family protein [Candidatus Thorarchaeota archaeon]